MGGLGVLFREEGREEAEEEGDRPLLMISYKIKSFTTWPLLKMYVFILQAYKISKP